MCLMYSNVSTPSLRAGILSIVRFQNTACNGDKATPARASLTPSAHVERHLDRPLRQRLRGLLFLQVHCGGSPTQNETVFVTVTDKKEDNSLCWPPFSPQGLGRTLADSGANHEESVVQRPSHRLRQSELLEVQPRCTHWRRSMVTWQGVGFRSSPWVGRLTKTVSFWLVIRRRWTWRNNRPRSRWAGADRGAALRVHSASARHVPESPLSPLQAVFWKRTMDRIPARRGRGWDTLDTLDTWIRRKLGRDGHLLRNRQELTNE